MVVATINWLPFAEARRRWVPTHSQWLSHAGRVAPVTLLHDILEGFVRAVSDISLQLHHTFHGKHGVEEVRGSSDGALFLENEDPCSCFSCRQGGSHTEDPGTITTTSASLWISAYHILLDRLPLLTSKPIQPISVTARLHVLVGRWRIARASSGVAISLSSSRAIRTTFSTISALLFAWTPFAR